MFIRFYLAFWGRYKISLLAFGCDFLPCVAWLRRYKRMRREEEPTVLRDGSDALIVKSWCKNEIHILISS